MTQARVTLEASGCHEGCHNEHKHCPHNGTRTETGLRCLLEDQSMRRKRTTGISTRRGMHGAERHRYSSYSPFLNDHPAFASRQARKRKRGRESQALGKAKRNQEKGVGMYTPPFGAAAPFSAATPRR